MSVQDRAPNFRKDGQIYLVRCFVCERKNGRENWAPAVASGKCAWCGWHEAEPADFELGGEG